MIFLKKIHIKNNRNIGALSGIVELKRAVTVQRTDIRALPTATEFYTFEQLVFLELNAIIRQNQLLRICPYCNKPFLSKSRKTKYCPADRNLGKVYQQKYKERTAEQNEYYKAAYRFKSSIDKRMRRLSSNAQEKVLYNLCIADIDNLLSHAQDYTLEEFTDYLNELLTKRGLKPLRKYSKN